MELIIIIFLAIIFFYQANRFACPNCHYLFSLSLKSKNKTIYKIIKSYYKGPQPNKEFYCKKCNYKI